MSPLQAQDQCWVSAISVCQAVSPEPCIEEHLSRGALNGKGTASITASVYSLATLRPELPEETRGEKQTPALWFENKLHKYRGESPISNHLLWM